MHTLYDTTQPDQPGTSISPLLALVRNESLQSIMGLVRVKQLYHALTHLIICDVTSTSLSMIDPTFMQVQDIQPPI